MRRGGENGFVQQVFPVTGELADRDDLGLQRLGAAAGAGEDHRFALAELAGTADFNDRQGDGLQRLHEAEPGFLIVTEDVAGDGPAGGIDHPDRRRLDDKVADGQYQTAVADDDAVAAAFGAERCRREGIVGNLGVDRHHRRQGSF